MAGGSSPNDEAIHARAADRTASRGDSTGMNATTRFRTELLAALDPRFEALGFLRRKEAFAWSRQVSAEQARSVHLNFGLYPAAGRVTVIPTVGVRFAALEAALVAAGVVPKTGSRDRSTVGFAIRPRNAQSYDFAAGDSAAAADTVWRELESRGFPQLEDAGTLDYVIASLASPDPGRWGILSRSARARVWPLALEVAGRHDEALAVLGQLEKDMVSIDQMVPPFEHFASWLRAHAGARAPSPTASRLEVP